MSTDKLETLIQDIKSRRIPPEVKKTVMAMLEKKAINITVLKLKGINDITDYMVICNGTSSRQNGAICDGVRKTLKDELKLKSFSVEGERDGDWILLDYIDFIVHIFSEESRRKYALEKLWMDAKKYNFHIDL